jgi:hypothetical protein
MPTGRLRTPSGRTSHASKDVDSDGFAHPPVTVGASGAEKQQISTTALGRERTAEFLFQCDARKPFSFQQSRASAGRRANGTPATLQTAASSLRPRLSKTSISDRR